jgi:hypothetical protein
MIADLHVDIWSNPDQWGHAAGWLGKQQAGPTWSRRDPTPQAVGEAARDAQAVFIHGYHSCLLEAEIPASLVKDYVNNAPDRFFGVAGVDPLASDADDRLHEALDLDMVGIRISPAAQGFHPCHSEAMRLFEFAARENLLVFVDQRITLSDRVQMEFAQPQMLDEIARQFPSLRLIIGQLGYPWIDQTLCLLAKHRNVFAETSDVIARPWHLYQALLAAGELGCVDRLLLASGFPQLTLREAVQQVHSINNYALGSQLPSVPRDILQALVNRDVFDVLGLASKRGQATATLADPPDDLDEDTAD